MKPEPGKRYIRRDGQITAPLKLKLEAGKRYIRRDGMITAPLTTMPGADSDGNQYPFYDPYSDTNYAATGHYIAATRPHETHDLVKEYIETPHVLASSFPLALKKVSTIYETETQETPCDLLAQLVWHALEDLETLLKSDTETNPK